MPVRLRESRELCGCARQRARANDMHRPGRLITFEGGEGAGKSTQTRALADRLRGHGITVVVTREPGGSPFAEALRDVLLAPREDLPAPHAQALVFVAARADHVAKVIRPALETGGWVICDRFTDSTNVYQGVVGGVPLQDLKLLDDMVLDGLRPDLTFILDVPVSVGLSRISARRDGTGETAADMFEAAQVTYHKALRHAFRALTETQPERCRLIDGTASEDEIAEVIWSEVTAKLEI